MKLFRYSRKDSYLVILALLQLVLTIGWCFIFEYTSTLEDFALLITLSFLFYYNPIVITHNFLHCPFFKKSKLNNWFAIVNSMNFGLPQILYRFHHLSHHRFENDPVIDGTTKDPSSTFRYGREGRQEHFLTYCAFGLFRDGTTIAFKDAIKKKSDRTQLIYEFAAALIFHATLIYFNWLWYFSCYVALFYVGWFLAHLENYYEHYAATDPTNRFANSVSYYNPLYNVLMFNEGYHQEHHLKPAVHWSQRPKVRSRFQGRFDENLSYEASMPPLLGFLDKENVHRRVKM